MTPEELAEIESRWERATIAPDADVSALIAEVKRLQTEADARRERAVTCSALTAEVKRLEAVITRIKAAKHFFYPGSNERIIFEATIRAALAGTTTENGE